MSYNKNNNNQYSNQVSNQVNDHYGNFFEDNNNNSYNNNYSNNNNYYDNNYSNNNNDYNNSSNNYVPRPYGMGGPMAINPRVQELNRRDSSNQYYNNASKSPKRESSTGTAINTPILGVVNNDDDFSSRSSIYSQPSTIDPFSRNNFKNYKEDVTTKASPNPSSLDDDNPRIHKDHLVSYPPSPNANSLAFNNNNHNNNPQQPSIDNHNIYNDNNNNNNNNSNNKNSNQQFDVYNDFNNNSNYSPSHNQTFYNSGDTTKNNTMTSHDDHFRNSSSYHWHNNSNKIDADKESNRQSMMGIGVDTTIKNKKRNRCCCCSGKLCVIITFIILIILGVVGYFVWPRIPHVTIDTSQSLNKTPTITQDPPQIKLDFVIPAEIDNKENWIPFRFNRIDVQVFDSNTISSFNKPIATGNITDYTLAPRVNSQVGFPLTVDYTATDANDPVIQDFISACTKQTDHQPTSLNFRVDVKIFVWGVDWIYKPERSIPVGNIKCPLPQ